LAPFGGRRKWPFHLHLHGGRSQSPCALASSPRFIYICMVVAAKVHALLLPVLAGCISYANFAVATASAVECPCSCLFRASDHARCRCVRCSVWRPRRLRWHR
ncbi:unnamed protein product, partial [Aphanomyces euteiches]